MFGRDKPVLLGSVTAILCVLGALAAPSASQAATALRPAVLAHPGANLLLNPGAQAGAYSAQGWDAVTIPGWRVDGGLPTVVRYGTSRFPRVTGRGPAVRGGQLFAGSTAGPPGCSSSSASGPAAPAPGTASPGTSAAAGTTPRP